MNLLIAATLAAAAPAPTHACPDLITAEALICRAIQAQAEGKDEVAAQSFEEAANASPDNDPAKSGPRGIAVRFHLADHVHTDIVAHSANGFPVRTGEEFLEFLRAAAAFGAGRPEALGGFLAAHPSAKRFAPRRRNVACSSARNARPAASSAGAASCRAGPRSLPPSESCSSPST